MRVKITFKTLQQKQFIVEAEPSETFLDVKKKIETSQGFAVDTQKIIFSGKIQPDDKTVGDANFKDKDFCVVMVSKPKAAPASAAAAGAPATPAPASTTATAAPPAAAAPAPAVPETPAQSSAPVVAPNAPAPAPTDSTAQAPEAETPSQSNQTGSSNSFLMGSALEESVQNMMAMGFPREQIMKAMRASYNNPDRAVDYLLNGIPESSMQDAPPSAPASAAPGTPSPASGNASSLAQTPAPTSAGAPATNAPRNLFEAAAAQSRASSTQTGGARASSEAESGGATGGAPTGELAALASQPIFAQLRQLVQQNPALLQPFLQQLGQSNPELLQMIERNQHEFVRFLQGGAEGDDDDGDMGDLMDQFGEGGEGGGEQYIQVTEEEKAAIDRLVAMGFERALVIQAYIACDRNEELAANYLLEHGFDFDD
ncbi:UV excision repair protein rad23 [Microbotryomycetes sp. JL201]|nr:UV excision repair protein rad23 [Microbotryomycetes sp. JL201]